MNIHRLKVSLLGFLLLLNFSTVAEDTKATAGTAGAGEEAGEQIDLENTLELEENVAGENSDDSQASDELSSTEPPRVENLKNRDLGAAFRTFRPTEEISADNAVPYPVDI